MAKKKGMNRTAGTARRKMSQSEQISYAIKTGKPLTGSASGVKSINLREAGEALTQGIVTVRGGKLKFDPAGLAMALPVGKLGKVARLLAPTNVRIAGAAGRVVSGAARRGQAAETAIELGKGLKQTGGYAKSSANAASRVATSTYKEVGGGRFSNVSTVFDGDEFVAPTRYVSNAELRSAGKKTASDLAQLGEARIKKGGQMIYDATKTLAKTTNRVEGGTREAAAEIRRRLAALKSRKVGK